MSDRPPFRPIGALGHWKALDALGHCPRRHTPPLIDGVPRIAHFLDRLTAEITENPTPFAFFGHSR